MYQSSTTPLVFESDSAMNILSHMVSSGHIPHALLFTGAKLDDISRQFACMLIGKYPHPDVREYFPEGKLKMHPISNLRKLKEEVALVPYQANYKLFIIHEAEKMLPSSSNALLKTFEEPAERTVIVLLSSHLEKLLPTVLSRCHLVSFPDSSSHSCQKMIEILAGRSKLSDLDEEQEIDPILETIMLWYRDRFCLHLGIDEKYLSYPEHQESIQKTPYIPLDEVEEVLRKVRLGYERFIKLTTCLEALFYQFQSRKAEL